MALTLKLHTAPDVPLEADCICPDRMQTLDLDAIRELTVFHGNRQVRLDDFFECSC